MEQTFKDHRLKGIQLHLTCLHSHSDGHIVAGYLVGDLADHLGNDRVDLAGHNGRAVLLCRQIDLTPAGAGAGGHKPQVVCDLGKSQSAGLQCARNGGKAIDILGGIDQILCLTEGEAGQIGQGLINVMEVGKVCIDACANGSATHIDGEKLALCLLQSADAAFHSGGIGGKFLTKADGNCILKLGATHFENGIKGSCLFPEGILQVGKGLL